ncbi:MAG: hypothetical protein HeimC3_05410 [Candidatus Heimdallarchaeota archaeon LC_3]|nr:MAG: hypothetical protein HeimC3_05410 [Candidatus Heimdallarchaeota archaeon LC_3]
MLEGIHDFNSLLSLIQQTLNLSDSEMAELKNMKKEMEYLLLALKKKI